MIIVRGCRMKLHRSAVLRHKDQADGQDRRRVADERAAGDGALPRGQLRVAAICGAAVMSAGVAGGRFAERPPGGSGALLAPLPLGREPRTANRYRRKPELPHPPVGLECFQ
jgi:hypothetical protein